jgi:HlyD family secretion protein
MKRLMKLGKFLIIFLILGLLIALAFWPKAMQVDLATVEIGNMLVTIDEEGETRVRKRFVISAPVAGQVGRIDLEPGDQVERGKTIIAVFNPAAPVLLDARSRAEAEANINVAQSNLGRARAELARALALEQQSRSDLKRVRALAEKQVASRQSVETAETQVRTAEEAVKAAQFSIDVAEHEVAMAKARLLSLSSNASSQPIIVQSPVDGVVLKRLRESEAVVPAGEPLVEIGNPGQLEIVADFLSTDAVKIHPGDAVLIDRWGGEKALNGQVRLIEPAGFMKISALGVEEQRVNVIIDFKDPLEAWKRLGHGYRVEVRVVLWQGERIIKVPSSSLFRHDKDWAVFVLEEGVAKLRGVQVGQRNGPEAQIRSGLSPGEKIVIYPSENLRGGSRIAPRQ